MLFQKSLELADRGLGSREAGVDAFGREEDRALQGSAIFAHERAKRHGLDFGELIESDVEDHNRSSSPTCLLTPGETRWPMPGMKRNSPFVPAARKTPCARRASAW